MSETSAKAQEQTALKPATTEQAVEGPATASTSTEPSKTQDDAVPTVTKISRFGLSLGKSIVTSHPLYLMGEAVLPGKVYCDASLRNRTDAFAESRGWLQRGL
jgi:hypothetical protein